MGCCASLLRCCVRADTDNQLLDSRHGGVGDGQVDLNVDFEELKDVHYLANGGMCSIYTAEWRGRRVVVKMPRDDCAQPEVARKDLETEIDILQRLDHPNIVEMLGAGFVCPLDVDADGRDPGDYGELDQEAKRFVLLEYLVGGTLTEQMCMRNPPADGMMSSVVRRWQQNWQFPMKKALDSALQLSSALSYLHSSAVEGSFVVHRDLKPENVAFSSDGRLKLFDFGLAKIVRRKGGRLSQRYEMTGETGSTRYMCPEVAMQLPYNEKADVYSFGLILWEMLSLRRPFDGLNRKVFVQSVIKGGRRPPLQQEWSATLRELLARCWDENMDTRPGVSVLRTFLYGSPVLEGQLVAIVPEGVQVQFSIFDLHCGVEFIEVEEVLREIIQREATWAGVLSGGPPAHAVPERANGLDAGSINGRAGSKALSAGADGMVGVGAYPSNGAASAGEAVAGTRTLV